MHRRDNVLLRVLFLGAILGIGAVVAAIGLTDTGRLRANIASAGVVAPIVFVMAYAALTLAWVPRSVLSAVGGLLFGFADGVALAFTGAMMGAVAAFWITRTLGREAVIRFTGARAARVSTVLQRKGLLAVFSVRLLPVVPFAIVNYAAGLAPLHSRDYFMGTAVGIIPGTVTYVAFGAYEGSVRSWPLVATIAGLLVATMLGVVVTRRTPNATRATGPMDTQAAIARQSEIVSDPDTTPLRGV